MKKVILITGASSGIGFQTASDLIDQGHIVYCAARSVGKMKPLADRGGKLLKMDITIEEDLKVAVATIIREQGKIDVLFNNAGYSVYGSVEETSLADAKAQYDVNLFGLARLTQLVIPYMRKQKSGTIINHSSGAGKTYAPLGAWYHSSKHALEGWSDCLRVELERFGIKVVILETGLVKTNIGSIVLDTLETSAHGPYAVVAKSWKDMMVESYENPRGTSSPQVISDAVQRIIAARRPKTRYAAGRMARSTLFMRWLLPDRWFDRFMYRMFPQE